MPYAVLDALRSSQACDGLWESSAVTYTLVAFSNMLVNDASLARPFQYQLEECPLFNLEAIEGHPMVFCICASCVCLCALCQYDW